MVDSMGFFDMNKRIGMKFVLVSVLVAALFIAFSGSAAADVVVTASGEPIVGALVKILEYPQYNDTTNETGGYSILNVPYDEPTGTTYTLRTRAAGYALNTTTVFINGPSATKNIILTPGVKYIASGQVYDAPRGGQWRTDFRVGNLGTQSTTLGTDFINLTGITKNTSEDVISKITSIDYPWKDFVTTPFGDMDGSGTVSSEQPIDVITMQRGTSAGKLGFFEGAALNIEKTQWFVSGMVWDAPRGGQWRSGFKVLNLGDVDASVTMYFYDSTGTQIGSPTIVTIPAKTSPYYDWYTYGYLASGSSTNAIEGTATVISTNAQPLNVVASQASGRNGKLGFWNGIYQNELRTDVFVTGMVWDAPRGGQWRTGFKVANLGSSPANVDIYFYNSEGTQIGITPTSVIIPPKASPYYDWYTYGYLASGSSSLAMEGTARVVSTNSVPVYVVESQASEGPGILDFYPAAELNGNNTAGLIYLEFQGGERSGFKIANPSDTSSVDVTIKFYNSTGVLVNTITSPNPLSVVPAKSSPYYAWNAFTSEPTGSVTVEANRRISVTASIASETESMLGIFKGIKV